MNAPLRSSTRSPLLALVLLSTLFCAPGLALQGTPTVEWEVELETPAGSSALDSQGNYVAGEGAQTTKLAPDGSVLWTRPFDLPGGHTVLMWTAVDHQDNIIRGGYHEASNGGFLAVKYDPAGNELWHSTALFGAGPQAIRAEVDEFGDVYVFGETWGGLTGTEPSGHDLLTVKFDSSGTFQWARLATASGSDEPTSLAVRGGQVAVTGRANGPFLTACYDYAGNVLWQRTYSDGVYGSNDVVIGPAGQVVVCGWGATNGNFPYNGIVVQYDSAGNEQWRFFHTSPGAYVDNFLRLAIDDAGRVTAVGWTSVGAYEDWSIVRIDPTGQPLWSAQHGGISYQSEWARALALGPAGEVYVGGNAGPTCTGIGTEGVIQKYAADGTLEWTFHDSCGAYPRLLALDASGSLYDTTSFRQVLKIKESIDGSYCDPASPNSSGSAAVQTVTGSPSFGVNNLSFHCNQLPTGTMGLFFHGDLRIEPGVPFGDGLLCAGGTVQRLGVLQGSPNSVSQNQDLTSSEYAGLVVGDTIHVQYWYRDVAAGGSGFNLSNAHALTLVP